MRLQIGFFVKLLDVFFVGPRQQFPIDVLDTFARIIGTVFGEFNGKSAERAFVHTRNKSLLGFLGQQIKLGEGLDFFE